MCVQLLSHRANLTILKKCKILSEIVLFPKAQQLMLIERIV